MSDLEDTMREYANLEEMIKLHTTALTGLKRHINQVFSFYFIFLFHFSFIFQLFFNLFFILFTLFLFLFKDFFQLGEAYKKARATDKDIPDPTGHPKYKEFKHKVWVCF